MKKIIITLAMLNLVATSMVFSGPQYSSAQAIARNYHKVKGYSKVKMSHNRPPAAKNSAPEYKHRSQPMPSVYAAENIAPAPAAVISPTAVISPAAAPISTTPPVTYGSRKEALAARRNGAPKISSFATNNLANQQAAQKIAQVEETGAILNKFEKFDKAYLGGSIASTLALFGYEAMKDKEAQQSATAVSEPEFIATAVSEPTVEDIKVPLAPEQPASNFLEFVKKHGYENPRNAMLSLYANPSSQTFLNSVSDPVIGGTLVTSIFGSYMYYQYLQSLEKQAKLEKDEK